MFLVFNKVKDIFFEGGSQIQPHPEKKRHPGDAATDPKSCK